MDPISVTIVVRGEPVTFVEPSFKNGLTIISKLRSVISKADFESGDGIAVFFNLIENPDTFTTLCTLLASASGKPAEFFEEMNFTDAANVYEGFRGSDFEKVVRRFFTKATKGQQTQG